MKEGPDLNPNSSFHTSLLYKRTKWGEKFKMAVINQYVRNNLMHVIFFLKVQIPKCNSNSKQI